MAISRFSKFNRSQKFTINKEDFVQGTWLTAKDIYESDMKNFGELKAHLLVGAWKHEFAEESRIPGAPKYKYTLGVKVESINKDGEVEANLYYVNAPTFMNKDFDEICNDNRLVKEINDGNCNVCAYEYESRDSICYGFEFC